MENCEPATRPRRSSSWNVGTLAAVIVAVAAGVWAGRGPRPAHARPQPAAPPARFDGSHTYRHEQVHLHQLDSTLTAQEAKGWETFQIVPLNTVPPNSDRTFILVFRRLTDVGK